MDITKKVLLFIMKWTVLIMIMAIHASAEAAEERAGRGDGLCLDDSVEYLIATDQL